MGAVRSFLTLSPFLFLFLLIPSCHVAHGATVAEVTEALTVAYQNQSSLRVAAQAWINLLALNDSQVDISGNITILLTADWMFIGYNFTKLNDPALTYALFNMHILDGLYSFNSIKLSPSVTQFPTKNPSETLKRSLYPGGNVYMRVAKANQGPRNNFENLSPIFQGDAYLGGTVYVHGVATLLTPSSFKGGPYQTRLLP